MIKRKGKSPEQIKKDKEAVEKRNKLFLGIWNKQNKHYSEVSGKPIYGECKTIYMHHILPKNSHSQAEFDEENIIILTPEEHQKVEQDMYFYTEINLRREKLKRKYNIV